MMTIIQGKRFKCSPKEDPNESAFLKLRNFIRSLNSGHPRIIPELSQIYTSKWWNSMAQNVVYGGYYSTLILRDPLKITPEVLKHWGFQHQLWKQSVCRKWSLFFVMAIVSTFSKGEMYLEISRSSLPCPAPLQSPCPKLQSPWNAWLKHWL